MSERPARSLSLIFCHHPCPHHHLHRHPPVVGGAAVVAAAAAAAAAAADAGVVACQLVAPAALRSQSQQLNRRNATSVYAPLRHRQTHDAAAPPQPAAAAAAAVSAYDAAFHVVLYPVVRCHHLRHATETAAAGAVANLILLRMSVATATVAEGDVQNHRLEILQTTHHSANHEMQRGTARCRFPCRHRWMTRRWRNAQSRRTTAVTPNQTKTTPRSQPHLAHHQLVYCNCYWSHQSAVSQTASHQYFLALIQQ